MLITADAPTGSETSTNVALAANGGTASASSSYSGCAASGAQNGDRKGLNYYQNGSWGAATATFPQWLQMDFNGSKTIGELDVFGLQDNYSNPAEPTETMTFNSYAPTAFDVQYWNGSGWVTVPGGSVTGNNKVWRKFTFAAITTNKIRVVTNASNSGWSEITEVEAWGTAASANINWLVTDQLGTPRMVFDQTGALANVKRHDYLPFGEELFANTGGRTTTMGYSAADGVRQKFTQKERDIETGLDYFVTRYYSSTQGRFTSSDKPFADQFQTNPQSWNSYSYVRNSPCNHVDVKGRCSAPSGLKPGQVGICIEAFIATKTFKTVGLGDNRDFSGDNEKLSARFRTDVIVSRNPVDPKNFDISQTTKASKSTVLLPNPNPRTGVFQSLQGTAQTALDGAKGPQGAETSSSITKSIDQDGQLRLNVSTSATSGFSTSYYSLGSIGSSLNVKINANASEVTRDQNTQVTGYPSIAAYGYVIKDGKTVTTTLFLSPEGSPDELKQPMKRLPDPPK